MLHRIAAALALALAGAASAEIETHRALPPDLPPGNIAVAPSGRVFMSVHGFHGAALRMVELLPDGTTRPYPTEAWARAPEGDGPGLSSVLGVRADRRGVLWMLDGGGEGHAGRVVGWDTVAERLHAVHVLAPPVTVEGSFLNDLAVDLAHGAIYVTDTAEPDTAALIVLDLATGRARRVLEGSRFTRPEDLDMVIDGRVVTLGGAPARIGANPITIDPTDSWVYFGPMSGRSLYRVRTTDLLDEALGEEVLADRVERHGDKPISDGITIDAAGNVYVASVTEDAIGVIRPDGRYETLHRRDDISWPDGFATGPDGRIHVTVNELHRSPVLGGGQDATRGEFKVMRFPALAPAVPGR